MKRGSNSIIIQRDGGEENFFLLSPTSPSSFTQNKQQFQLQIPQKGLEQNPKPN